jgi:hypothetical protein
MQQSLSLLVLALVVCLGLFSQVTAFKPVEFPASQTSVSSTAFNPAETNAGGTTNSAGTFNVVSLSISSNYVYNSDIPQTTSFVVQSAQFASSAAAVTPTYYTPAPSNTVVAAKSTSSSSISLITTGNVQVSAVTTPTGDGATRLELATGAMWTFALSGTFAVIGALLVL